MRNSKIIIGTSGWSYPDWKENFYPEDVKQANWLNFYASHFPSVEINTTFYHTPRDSTIKKWYEEVPKNFKFSIKVNQYITHRKRLNDCKESMKFFYKNIKGLKEKVGPILFQLPPSFQQNKERLLDFIKLVDKDYETVFEFRHSTWYTDEIYDIFSDNNLALCITDLNGKKSPEILTADFAYLRLHGPHKAYQGSYGPNRLKTFQKKFESWKTKVYCYFDNDAKGCAIEDADYLLKRIK